MNKQVTITLIADEAAHRLYNRARASERWPEGRFTLAELIVSPAWIDLCWWNGTAWQYITTRPNK